MKLVSYFREFLDGELLMSFDFESGRLILCWLRELLINDPWSVPDKLKGSTILPFSSYLTYPPFLTIVDSTIVWNPAPKPAYFYLIIDYLTGNIDQFLTLSSFPSAYPRSFEHEMHLICFDVINPYLSSYVYPTTMTINELILFYRKRSAFLV